MVVDALLDYRDLSAFVHHFDSLRQDRRVLQECYRQFVGTIASDTPIFPWTGDTRAIHELVASGRAKSGTELEVRAAAVKEILDTTEMLSDRHKELQLRSRDYPAHSEEMNS